MQKNSTPSRRGKTAYGVLAALLAAASLPAMAQDEAPTVRAGNLGGGEITVDGRLDEPAWQQAGVIQDLTQQSPHPGESTPYHTKVLVLRDHHYLYIGLRCEDPDISRVSNHTLIRDGNQGSDDSVIFMLDRGIHRKRLSRWGKSAP